MPLTEAPELGAVVLVVWRDAHFDFNEPDEPRGDYQVRTVGWVVDTDDLWISVAAEELPDDDGFRAITRIPRAVILKIERFALAAHDSPKPVVAG
jgi:hypothetical protein